MAREIPSRFARRPVDKKAKAAPRPRTVPAAKKVFLVGIFIVAQLIFANSDFFRLRSIEIKGNERVSPDEIMKSAAVPWGANVAFFKILPCQQSIEKILWIKNATIRTIYPGGVQIEVRERNPVIRIASEKDRNRWFFADEEGMILCPVENNKGPESPRLVVPGSIAMGQKIDSDHVDIVHKFTTWLTQDLSTRVSYFMVEPPSQIDFFYRIGEKDVEVKLGRLEDVEKKIGVFNEILKQMEGKMEQLEYVDLRYNAPVVKIADQKSPEKKKENNP